MCLVCARVLDHVLSTVFNLNNCLANNCNVGGHGGRRCSSENRPNSDSRDDFSFLATSFDVGHEMTRRLHHSKALVEAHLFRGVSSQSEHFPKIGFSAKNGLATEVDKSGSYLKLNRSQYLELDGDSRSISRTRPKAWSEISRTRARP